MIEVQLQDGSAKCEAACAHSQASLTADVERLTAANNALQASQAALNADKTSLASQLADVQHQADMAQARESSAQERCTALELQVQDMSAEQMRLQLSAQSAHDDAADADDAARELQCALEQAQYDESAAQRHIEQLRAEVLEARICGPNTCSAAQCAATRVCAACTASLWPSPGKENMGEQDASVQGVPQQCKGCTAMAAELSELRSQFMHLQGRQPLHRLAVYSPDPASKRPCTQPECKEVAGAVHTSRELRPCSGASALPHVHALQRQCEELTHASELQRAELDEQVLDLQHKLNASDAKAAETMQRCSELEAEKQTIEVQQADTLQQMQALQAQARFLQDQLNSAQAELAHACTEQAATDAAAAALQDLEAEVALARTEVADLAKRLAESQAAARSRDEDASANEACLRDACSAARRREDEAQERAAALEHQVSVLEQELQGMQSESSRALAGAAEVANTPMLSPGGTTGTLIAELGVLTDAVAEQRAEVATLQREHSAMERLLQDHRARVDGRQTSCCAPNADSSHETQHAILPLADCTATLPEQLRKCLQEARQYQLNLQAAQSSLVHAQCAASEQSTSLNHLWQEVAETSAAVKQLEAKRMADVQQVQQKLADADHAHLAEIKALHGNLTEMAASRQQLEAAAQAIQSDLANAKAQHASQLRGLQLAMQKMQAAHAAEVQQQQEEVHRASQLEQSHAAEHQVALSELQGALAAATGQAEARITRVHADWAAYEQDHAQVLSQAKVREAELQDEVHQLQRALATTVEAHADEVARLQVDLDACVTSHSEAERLRTELREALDAAASNEQRHTVEMEQLQADVERVATLFTRLREERDALLHSNSQLQTQVADAHTQIQAAQQVAEDVKAELAYEQQALHQERSAHDVALEEATELQGLCDRSRALEADLNDQLAAAQHQVQVLQRKLAILDEGAADHAAAEQRLRLQVDELNDRLIAARTEQADTVQAAHDTYAAESAKVKALHAQDIGTLQVELAQRQAALDEARLALSVAADLGAEHTAAADKLQKEIQAASEEAKSAASLLAAERAECAAVKRQLADVEVKLADSKQQLQESAISAAALQQQVDDAEVAAAKFADNVQAEKSTLNERQGQLVSLQDELRQAEEQVSNAVASVVAEKHAHESTQQRLAEAVQAAAQSSDTVAAAEQRAKNSQQAACEAQAALSAAQTELSTLQHAEGGLHMRSAAKERDLEKALHALAEMFATLTQRDTALAELHETLSACAAARDTSEAECVSLRAQLDAAQSDAAALQQAETKAAAASKRAESAEASSQAACEHADQLAHRVHGLEEALAACRAHHSEQDANASSIREQLAAAHARVAESADTACQHKLAAEQLRDDLASREAKTLLQVAALEVRSLTLLCIHAASSGSSVT